MEKLASSAAAWDPPAAHERFVRVLVVLAIIATVFNDLMPLLPAGELESDAFVYIFPLLLLYLFRRPGQIAVPAPLLFLVILLVVAVIAGVAANFDAISTAHFKARSGVNRVLTQGMMLGFGFAVVLLFYNLTIRGFLPMMARGARIAVLIMAGVGLLEASSWYNFPGLTQAHEAVSMLVHSGLGLEDYAQRLRMTAFEVSWAAVMLTFLFPFAIMDLPLRGWKLPAFIILILLLTLLAQSRTALLVLGIQILILMWKLLRQRFDVLLHLATVGILAALVLVLTPSTSKKISEMVHNMIISGSPSGPQEEWSDENVSNVTRLASIQAGLKMFRETPIVGVGLGQYGFEYPGAVRAEDFRSWEVRIYVADTPDATWPPGFSLHVRMLAETGLVGYVLFIAMVVPILIRAFAQASVGSYMGRVQLSMAMTLTGWMLLGFSIDSFRFFGGWIAMGVGYGLPVLAERLAPRSPEASSAGIRETGDDEIV